MPCKDSKAQTEYEYFQQLAKYPDSETCAGPLTLIGFTNSSLMLVKKLFSKLTLNDDYIELLSPSKIDEDCIALSMCAKHWMITALQFNRISGLVSYDRQIITDLAYFIFKLTCLSNDWDYKEVTNYTQNLGKGK